jgi:hypothetical protein
MDGWFRAGRSGGKSKSRFDVDDWNRLATARHPCVLKVGIKDGSTKLLLYVVQMSSRHKIRDSWYMGVL